MNITAQINKVARYTAKAEEALFRYAIYLCEERNIPYECIEKILYQSMPDITDICILGKTMGRIRLIYNKPNSDEFYLNIVINKAILPDLWDRNYKLIKGNNPEFIE